MFHVGEIFCRAKCDGIFLMADKSVLNILVLLDRFWMNDAYEKVLSEQNIMTYDNITSKRSTNLLTHFLQSVRNTLKDPHRVSASELH